MDYDKCYDFKKGKERLKEADDKCFNAQMDDLINIITGVPFYPLIAEQFDKNRSLKINDTSYQDFQIMKNVLPPSKSEWDHNIRSDMCEECTKNVIKEFLEKRRCFNLKTVMNVLNFLNGLSDKPNPKKTAIGNAIYLGKGYADLNQEQRKSLRVSEEHIVPASILAYYFTWEGLPPAKKDYNFFYFDGTNKSLSRELNPILTDLHNIYMTTGNINTSRSNFMLGNIQPYHISAAIKFDMQNPSNCRDGPAEIVQKESTLDFRERSRSPRPRRSSEKDKNKLSASPIRGGNPRAIFPNPSQTQMCKSTGSIKYKPEEHPYPAKCHNNIQGENITSENWNLINEALKTVNKYSENKDPEQYFRVSQYFNEIPDTGFYNMCLSNQCMFEPIDEDKGKVARTIFYFYIIYGIAYKDRLNPGIYNAYFNNEKNWQTFVKWHKEHPVTDEEQLRNMRIAHIQGAPNPFISYRTPQNPSKVWGEKSDLFEKIFTKGHGGKHYEPYGA